ncbi:MAG: SBBP repeat-containing protein [Ignavibacteriales bacterium]|nr:SBBP repeat-containing protein [Ignavibacteriales bacterium]
MKKIIVLLAAFIFAINTFGQVVEEWVSRFNGVSNAVDEPTAMAVDDSGNVYITGRSTGVGSIVNPWDIVTIKYDSNGVEIWTATFGNDNNQEEANDIKVDNEGNVYITGYRVNDQLNTDFLTIKYNAIGDTVWVRTHNGPANAGAEAVALAVDTISGTVYVTGSSKGVLTLNDNDYLTIAYGSNGEQLWVSIYDGPGNSTDLAKAIAFRPGEVLVTGSSETTTLANSTDYLTIKLSAATGDTVWTKRYNGIGNDFDEPKSIAVDLSGNVYVTGIGSRGNQPTDRDYVTIKYNTGGEEDWVSIYNNESTDEAKSIAVDTQGNVYVTGVSGGFGNDYATIKYNLSGVEQWVKRYHGGVPFSSNFDAASALTVDENSNVYVTGSSVEGLSTNDADFFTIKYNSDGDSLWTARYNGPGNDGDVGIDIALDNFGNIYVIGTSIGIGTASDYTLIKYKQTPVSGLDDKTGNILIGYNLSNNYPNPFNPTTKIKYTIPARNFVTLKVYDVLGNEIVNLVNQEKQAGSYEINFDAINLSSGIYFYKLQTGDFVHAKKMILLK